MINNRQQSGRRRGRGGQRPQGGQGRSDQGSRIDNRARGNAAQLLEKYKTLARDAQMQGDRVMTEYYLQFADHYFRVVSETRARFEENQPRRTRDDNQEFDEEGGEDFRADDSGEGEEGQPVQQEYRDNRGENRDSRDNRDRDNRDNREDRNRNRNRDRQPQAQSQQREPREPRYQVEQNEEAPAQDVRSEVPSAPRSEPRAERRPRTERPRRVSSAAEANGNVAEPHDDAGFADRLPPALSPVIPAAPEDVAAAPKPRVRRPRKVEVTEAPVES